MKNIAIASFLTLSLALSGQTVSTDFESSNGNRGAETCWSFGGFSLTKKSNHKPISGYSARSGSLNNNKSSFWLKSPFINLNSGNITFKAKLHNSDGTRTYNIYVDFIPYDANDTWGEDDNNIVTGSVYTLTTPHNSTQNVSIAIPSSIANDGNAYKVYWRFESASGNRNRRMLVDDISIPGTYVSDPSNNCKVLAQTADSDFDGVDDDNDEFPTDPNRAYTVTDVTFGTIAYEDLWPAKGDYDFNDLVLGYRHEYVYDADNKVKEINTKYVVRALGGDLIEGFGVHFNGLSPNAVQSVSGNSLTTGTISQSGNGTELSQTYATIILCDNVEDVINRTSGAFFNTVPTNPTGTSDTLDVKIILTNSVNSSNLSGLSIFAFKDRDEEIHMKDNAPTDLADQSLFGTIDDASNAGTGVYYCTQDGHPWAIQVSEEFDYPVERKDIVQAYLKFAEWAQSGGANSTNWYTEEAGNRNSGDIY